MKKFFAKLVPSTSRQQYTRLPSSPPHEDEVSVMTSSERENGVPDVEMRTPMDLDGVTTGSLEALQSVEQREILDIVDQLRRQGLSGIVGLPQLAVCGDQSSGKSSVLEAVSIIQK
jgi:hypothetical protein